MKFIVDARLPPALARLLRESGCDAFAVREIGLREANDAAIWRYAVQQQAAIITKDEDFAERCLYSRDQPVQALLRWFVPLWPEIMRRIELGDRLIEVFLKAATLGFNQAVRDSKKQEIEKA